MYREGITFVVPAYNTETTIGRTLDSILMQTDSRYEIVIVNDGSSDGTEDVCKGYESAYPDRIRYVRQENRGLGGARNRGLMLAGREYVSFLDSDDWLMPGYVRAILEQVDKRRSRPPEMIMVLPKIYDENSKEVKEWYDAELFKKIFGEDGAVIDPAEDDRILFSDVNQCRKLLRTEFAGRIHFRFREKVKWEDVCPHFFLLSECRSCMGVGSTGFYYRKGNSGQITASRGADRLDLPVVFRDLLELVQEQGMSCRQAERMIHPAMHILVGFAMEGVRVADTDTRERLVEELYVFFCTVPARWHRIFRKNCRKHCSRREALRLRVFHFLIKSRFFHRFLCDYLYQEAAEAFLKKAVHAAGRKEGIHGTA